MNCITFAEAQAFCLFIGGRLPTPDEWELGANGGEGRIYPWGNEPVTSERANFCDEDCAAIVQRPPRRLGLGVHDGFASLSPVGAFPKGTSRFGVLDLAGNVREWTAPNPKGLAPVMGGSFAQPASQLRASARSAAFDASHWDAQTGFRCVFDQDPQVSPPPASPQ